jgi:hypothetical protein
VVRRGKQCIDKQRPAAAATAGKKRWPAATYDNNGHCVIARRGLDGDGVRRDGRNNS